MELKGKRIVLFSPEPWEGLHMSKHHISQALVAWGSTVVFVDPPTDRVRAMEKEERDGVTLIRYRHWLRGVNRMPRFVNDWYYRRLIDRIAASTGGGFDIIWTFDTSRMQWFPSGPELKLLYLADHDILRMGPGLIPTADLVLTTSRVVAEDVAPLAKGRTVNVGHSLDRRWLQGIDALRSREIASPRLAVFAGQMAITYNDYDGFLRIAKQHPGMTFRYIGPYQADFPDPAFQELKSQPNVEILGLVSKDRLIPMVREADILFFGFRSGRYAKERANPHKVLEYLSTGNVVVGSWTMEYADRPDLFVMAPSGGDIADRFTNALERFDDLNSPAARSRRIDAVKDRSIESLIRRIEELLNAESHG